MKEVKAGYSIWITMTIINVLVLWNFIASNQIAHGIGYFIFFYAAILVIHFFTKKMPPQHEFDVKNPKQELTMTLLFSLLGLAFLTLNFMLKNGEITSQPLIRIPILLGSILFAFPIGLLIYLLIKKYKILNLGLITKPMTSILLGILIWGLTGLCAYLFYPEGILWARAYKELGGVVGILLQGILGAALVEEFSRFMIQSRLEKVLSLTGYHILMATIIWSFMHFPVTYFKGADFTGCFQYCIRIIPLGFIWGYMTQRTQSIVPSTVAHGINLWGFQNS